jgi:hypothetical protein
VSNVIVTNGTFTVSLDFGACASCFTGATRFLEIAVKPNSGGSFTTLSPRQQITTTQYAIKSLNATTATTAEGLGVACVGCVTNNQIEAVDGAKITGSVAGSQISGAIPTASVPTGSGNYIQNSAAALKAGKQAIQQEGGFDIDGDGIIGSNLIINGQVGIGTASPQSKLSVQSSGYGITQTDGTVTVGSFINPSAGWLGTKSNHPLNFFTNDSLAQMTLTTNGNVGIGTLLPTSKLFVLNSTPGTTAIYGESATGRGVWGKSTSSRGVYGESTSLEGIFGISSSAAGVRGASTSNSGVYGESPVSSLTAGGVYGKGTGSGSIGVIGESNINNAVGVFGVSSSPDGFGVYARNLSGGRALFVEGNAGQDLASNGLVKAMALIHVVHTGSNNTSTASIVRCYNSTINSTSGNCGFSFGTVYGIAGVDVNFGFTIDNRFISVTGLTQNSVTLVGFINATTVSVLDGSGTEDFYIFVY